MNITEILGQVGGLQSIAKELGINEKQAAAGAEGLVPAILGGFKKQAQGSGVEGLGGLLGQLGGGSLLDEVVADQPTNVDHGNSILGQIFGSKEVSRSVAANAATKTGIDASVLKKMLPLLAMAVTGYMAKQHASSQPAAEPAPQSGGGLLGGLGNLLGGLLGGKSSGAGAASPGMNLGGLASMLDLDGDGNPLDDILGMVSKKKK